MFHPDLSHGYAVSSSNPEQDLGEEPSAVQPFTAVVGRPSTAAMARVVVILPNDPITTITCVRRIHVRRYKAASGNVAGPIRKRSPARSLARPTTDHGSATTSQN